METTIVTSCEKWPMKSSPRWINSPLLKSRICIGLVCFIETSDRKGLDDALKVHIMVGSRSHSMIVTEGSTKPQLLSSPAITVVHSCPWERGICLRLSSKNQHRGKEPAWKTTSASTPQFLNLIDSTGIFEKMVVVLCRRCCNSSFHIELSSNAMNASWYFTDTNKEITFC